MSFQLSANVAVPIAPVSSKVVKVPSKIVSAHRATSMDLETYKKHVDEYEAAISGYKQMDTFDEETRRRVDAETCALRAQFEQLSMKLSNVQAAYRQLREHDDTVHERREALRDDIVYKRNLLPLEIRGDAYQPPVVISRVNSSDTSSKFRDMFGSLTGKITEQATDRSPDWLDALADVVGAVADGWHASSDTDLEKPATNDVKRSRQALSKAVRSHALTHANANWSPAVTLLQGESLTKDVRVALNWNDMYDFDATVELAAKSKGDDYKLKDLHQPVEADNSPMVAVNPTPLNERLGSEELPTLSLSVLTEIGNAVELKMRQKVEDRMAEDDDSEVAMRAQHFARLGGGITSAPWYKR